MNYERRIKLESSNIRIGNIPAIIWGSHSKDVYIFVHGKMSKKEDALEFAEIAIKKGYHVLSFDLPEHGERKNEKYLCTIQNGVKDLTDIINFAKKKWEKYNLFACSLGAYFSLVAYKNITFDNCLFLSPILDMEQLIKNMMKWFDVSEEKLEKNKEISTPMGETLSWDYYCYVKDNPVNIWNSPTYILYGTKDNLTEKSVVDLFVKKYNCKIELVENGEHYFQSPEQIEILYKWFNNYI
ncbi:MAG: alpha/beta hydrolase [Treponema sp. CETP13]|nr:MAG: alpha/beta hydrolase [Treponema sp. CETP13]